MKEINCAICGKIPTYKILYPQRINFAKIDFSARRTPQKIHYQIVECGRCGLIYSNPIFHEEKIIELYRQSKFINEPQLTNYLQTYKEELAKLNAYIERKENLLEIGCASGFFLEAALEMGFKNVIGVEPCENAIEQAVPKIKDKIILDIFKDKLFEYETFDVICFFQIFDHLVDPNSFLVNVYKVLKPGGLILSVNHNIHSWLTRILGENSPMFDIGHIYLFDKVTMKKILEDHNFEVLYINNLWNNYTLEYSLKMFPLAGFLKKFLINILRIIKISNIKIKIPGGNMVAVARKSK